MVKCGILFFGCLVRSHLQTQMELWDLKADLKPDLILRTCEILLKNLLFNLTILNISLWVILGKSSLASSSGSSPLHHLPVLLTVVSVSVVALLVLLVLLVKRCAVRKHEGEPVSFHAPQHRYKLILCFYYYFIEKLCWICSGQHVAMPHKWINADKSPQVLLRCVEKDGPRTS